LSGLTVERVVGRYRASVGLTIMALSLLYLNLLGQLTHAAPCFAGTAAGLCL
jgi:hypothetical protein